MISHLKGTLVLKKPPFVVIDINGLGYECQVSMQTFYQLPEIGSSVLLQTHLIIREDAHLLFGFISSEERVVFRHLIKINGVGPKLALSILSSLSVPEVLAAIQTQDISAMIKIPGVGKKTAQRLLMEVRDTLFDEVDSLPLHSSKTASETIVKGSQVSQEAIEALFTLGYKVPQAKSMISSVYEEGLGVEALIRKALRNTVGA